MGIFSAIIGALGFLRDLLAGARGERRAGRVEFLRLVERVRDQHAETIAWLRKCHPGYPTLELQQAQGSLRARLDHLPASTRADLPSVEFLATAEWGTLMPKSIEELEEAGRIEIAAVRER